MQVQDFDFHFCFESEPIDEKQRWIREDNGFELARAIREHGSAYVSATDLIDAAKEGHVEVMKAMLPHIREEDYERELYRPPGLLDGDRAARHFVIDDEVKLGQYTSQQTFLRVKGNEHRLHERVPLESRQFMDTYFERQRLSVLLPTVNQSPQGQSISPSRARRL